MIPPRSTLHRYLLALLIILLTLLTRFLMAPLWETTAPYALFMLAVVAAAWSAGSGPAVIVGAAGLAMRAYYDAPRIAWIVPTKWEEGARMVLFAVFAAGTAFVIDRMRASARELEATLARAQAEIEERQRTEQALRETERELRRAIEDQKRMEDMLVAARLKAEETNRLKDEFLAMVSHELRTPLNAILGWASLMRANALTPLRSVHAIDVIERNARHQAQLVGDLLDVARSLSGRLHLEASRLDLVPVLEAALTSLREPAAAKSLNLVFSTGEAPLPVWGDARRLQQIAWNLLSNAIKFTPAGGTVEISAHEVQGHARVSISDTGAGIEPEFLPRIFDRFTQADGGATRAHGGLGLGLTLVRQLVQLHRGSIEAASEGLSKGARFTVMLPLHRSDRDPEDLPRQPTETQPAVRA